MTATSPLPTGPRLAILGAGGHARVVADAAEAAGWTVAGLFDDQTPQAGPWPVLGGAADLFRQAGDFDGLVVALGDNGRRLDLTRRLAAQGAPLALVVHPTAWISPRAAVRAGSVILAGAVVGTGARLGRGVIVNTGASVDHDCRLEDGVHVSPGARLAGGVTVGEGVWIGIGAVVREGVAIGAGARLGAGAAVVAPVAAGITVVGVPARPLEDRGC